MNNSNQQQDDIINEIIEQICNHNQVFEQKIIAEEIYSIKRLISIQQHLPYLCGFYTLYNTYFPINLNQSTFWKFYFQLIKELNKTFNGDFENFDELQRYHLDYILNNKIIEQLDIFKIQNKQEKEIITLMYGCDIIQNSLDELVIIQNKFEQLKTQKISNLTIICGITIHYLVVDLKWEQNKLEIYLIDSLNESIIKLFNKQQIIDQFLPLEKRRRKIYKIDLRNILMIIQRLLNNQDIVDIYLENAINALKENFDDYEERLKEWIQNEYPVPVIRHMILNVAKHFNKKLYQMQWIMERKDQELLELQKELINLI